jgi:hypothetical protein
LLLRGTLTPHPPLPSREKGSKTNFWFPSPLLGEQGGFIFGKASRKGVAEKTERRKVRKNKNKREYQKLDEVD